MSSATTMNGPFGCILPMKYDSPKVRFSPGRPKLNPSLVLFLFGVAFGALLTWAIIRLAAAPD